MSSDKASNNVPSSSFHIPNLGSGFLLRVPNHDILQITGPDLDMSRGPDDVVTTGRIFIDGVGELRHVNALATLDLWRRPGFFGRLRLVIVRETGQGQYPEFIRGCANVIMEQRLECYRRGRGEPGVLDVQVRAQLVFRQSHDKVQVERVVELLFDRFIGLETFAIR